MKCSAPAALRNRDAIAEVLRDELPAHGMVLEIASGTGEHAVHFARAFPSLRWQASDADESALGSIAAWRAEAGLGNLLEPVRLDAGSPDWPVTQAHAIVCINMVHISPPAASEGLFAGAARLLAPDAPLILYGPYVEDGVETAPPNLAFDRSLRERDARWGLRNIAWLDELAADRGLARTRRQAMPANNLMLVYRAGA